MKKKKPSEQQILGLLHLQAEDIEEFLCCGVDVVRGKKVIYIFTRAGGVHQEHIPNESLIHHPLYLYDEDDRLKSKYRTYYFRIPDHFKVGTNRDKRRN